MGKLNYKGYTIQSMSSKDNCKTRVLNNKDIMIFLDRTRNGVEKAKKFVDELNPVITPSDPSLIDPKVLETMQETAKTIKKLKDYDKLKEAINKMEDIVKDTDFQNYRILVNLVLDIIKELKE